MIGFFKWFWWDNSIVNWSSLQNVKSSCAVLRLFNPLPLIPCLSSSHFVELSRERYFKWCKNPTLQPLMHCHKFKFQHSSLVFKNFHYPTVTHLSNLISLYILQKVLHFSHRESLLLFFFLVFSRAAPVVYGGSQARGPIRAAAASLRHSHSHARSKPCLRPTPQLTATSDPSPAEWGQGSNPQPHGS